MEAEPSRFWGWRTSTNQHTHSLSLLLSLYSWIYTHTRRCPHSIHFFLPGLLKWFALTNGPAGSAATVAWCCQCWGPGPGCIYLPKRIGSIPKKYPQTLLGWGCVWPIWWEKSNVQCYFTQPSSDDSRDMDILPSSNVCTYPRQSNITVWLKMTMLHHVTMLFWSSLHQFLHFGNGPIWSNCPCSSILPPSNSPRLFKAWTEWGHPLQKDSRLSSLKVHRTKWMIFQQAMFEI